MPADRGKCIELWYMLPCSKELNKKKMFCESLIQIYRENKKIKQRSSACWLQCPPTPVPGVKAQDTSIISMLPEKVDWLPTLPKSSRDLLSTSPSPNSI